MASGSGGNPPEHGGGPAGKECESCHSAPGIPFCRVEWSFLCAGCAAVVHANNWIIAVPPNPNPNPNSNPSPYPYPYPYPFPNSNPNPNHDPNLVVQLSSSDDARKGGRRGRRRSAGKAAAPPRAESVMRYREKRKSRQFEKTVRYETRKAYADQRPRVDGKFARPEASGGQETPVPADQVGMPDAHFPAMVAASDEVGMPDAYFPVMPSAGEEAGPHAGEEVMLPAVGELGLMDAGQEVRLQ